MSVNGYQQHFKKLRQSQQNVSDVQYNQIAQNLQKRRSEKKSEKKKRKFPIVHFLVFGLCSLGLFYVVENFDQIENKLINLEVSIGLSQAEASKTEDGSKKDTKSESHETKGDVKSESKDEKKQTIEDETKKDTNSTQVSHAKPESEDDYLFQLNDRKKQLDQREEELNKKAQEIENQRNSLDAKIKELEQYREKISVMLQEKVKADSGKIDTLVQLYSNMRPNQAAKVFETMDEELVIDILTKMKRKTAADILNLMKAEKAQAFAERYSGYRLPANAVPKNATLNKKDDNSGDQIPENNSNTKQKEDSAQ